MEKPFSSCTRAPTTPCAAILGVLLVSASAVAAELPVPKGKRVLEPFNYCGVRLGESRLRLEFDEVRDDYLRIPNDDLLKGFRQRAGLPAPGADLGGWYTSDTFHVFGQIVSGLSRMYAATGDPACRDKVNTLVAEWAKCIAPDGFFFYSTEPNARHYIYDKTVCGLVDACLYCRNTEALSHLSRITDWAIKNLERSRKLGDTGTEWYTLSENLYRAYLATGDTKYRDFAEVWEYSEYWDFYAGKADPLGPRPNAERDRLANLAFERFAQGDAIEDVMHQTQRSRSWCCDKLCEYIGEERPDSVRAWVADEVYQQVAAAAKKVGTDRLKPIHIELGEKVSYDEIRIVVAHLLAHQE